MSERPVREDLLQPFLFDALPVRGAIVRLGQELQPLLQHQPSGELARHVLAEASVASLLIANAMKFTGSLTLQIAGPGPLAMLVAQARNNLDFRGTFMWRDAKPLSGPVGFEALADGARCSVIINSADERERYQGIVSVEGASLAESLMEFFTRSVQLPSQLFLAADAHQAGGILLQILGDAPEFSASDDWARLQMLLATLTLTDFKRNDCVQLLKKLFAEDDLRLLDARAAHWQCQCSDQRALSAVQTLGEADALAAAAEQGGALEVTCEYCGRTRVFDSVDIRSVFHGAAGEEPRPDLH